MNEKKRKYIVAAGVLMVLMSAGYVYVAQSDEDFFASYDPAAAEVPPVVVAPVPPVVKAPEKAEELALFTLDVPLLGKLNLVPFTDETKTPPEDGFKLVFADKSKKVTMGAMTIDEGAIQYVGGKIGITGQATLFDKKARFGLKEIDFVAEKKFIKRIVFGVDFIDKPAFEIIPGVPESHITLTTAELEVERDKPLILRSQQNIFGQKVVISFMLATDNVDASLKLIDTPLNSLITAVNDTPLAKAIVKSVGLELKNIYSKDSTQKKFTVVLGGQVDLTPTALSDDPKAVSNLALTCSISSSLVDGSITAQQFPMADIGIINKALISIKSGVQVAGTPSKTSLTLSGDLSFNVGEVGDLEIDVASTISKKGVEFSGGLKKPFTYAGIAMNKGRVMFDTVERIVDILGDISYEGLELAATFGLKPDPAEPKDKTKRTMVFTAKAKTKEFKPFAGIGVPTLETVTMVNIDAGIEIVKKSGQQESKALRLDGDVTFLGVSVRSLLRFIVNPAGKKGIYVNVPCPKNWTLSQSIPELKGPIFDGLIFEEAAFVLCSVDGYVDPDTNVTVAKGAQIYAQMPLKGTLQPVADLLGSSGQTFTLLTTITPNPRDMVLGIKVSGGVPMSTKAVSIGDTEILIKGTPSLGLRANVLVRPSDKDLLTFSGEFKLGAIEASMDVGMQGSWKNPFGINGLSLSDTYLTLGITYGAPLPTKFGVAAKLGVSATNTIEFAVVADAKMEHMALKGKANKLSFMELITGFARPMGIAIPDPNIPILDLRDVEVRFAATDTTIGKEVIEQGVRMAGKMDLMGEEKAAELNVKIDPFGIEIKGYTKPIDVGGILKVSGLSGQTSPCAGGVVGGSHQDRPEVDIELKLNRQVFLVQGAMVLGSEANGVFYKVANCLKFDRSGIGFEFLSQIGGNKLLYSRVAGRSSGPLSNPQFELAIDFEQHLQQFIKDQVNNAFNLAQREIVNGINKAQDEIRKIDQIKADASTKIKEAEAQVAAARATLASIEGAIKQSDDAFASAQQDVSSIDGEIKKLQTWWNGLPAY
jgi:hypothetical protein